MKTPLYLSKILGIATLFIVVLVVLQGCSDTLITQEEAEEVIVQRKPGEFNMLLASSEDFRELRLIHKEIETRVLSTGAPPDELREAYRKGDEKEIIKLMGFTEDEMSGLAVRLKHARNNLIEVFPEIRLAIENESECINCEDDRAEKVDKFFSKFDYYTKRGDTRPSPFPLPTAGEVTTQAETGCQYLQYTICLGLCTLAGPIIYWPCAYLCYCTYCSDDLGICI